MKTEEIRTDETEERKTTLEWIALYATYADGIRQDYFDALNATDDADRERRIAHVKFLKASLDYIDRQIIKHLK